MAPSRGMPSREFEANHHGVVGNVLDNCIKRNDGWRRLATQNVFRRPRRHGNQDSEQRQQSHHELLERGNDDARPLPYRFHGHLAG